MTNGEVKNSGRRVLSRVCYTTIRCALAYLLHLPLRQTHAKDGSEL